MSTEPGDRPSARSKLGAVIRRSRVAVGVILLLGFSFAEPCRFVESLSRRWSSEDVHDRFATRYEHFIDTLPPKGIYGFRTIEPLSIGRNHELQGDGESIFRYVLAQYLLAPRVLDLSRSRSPVVRDDLEPVRVRAREGR